MMFCKLGMLNAFRILSIKSVYQDHNFVVVGEVCILSVCY